MRRCRQATCAWPASEDVLRMRTRAAGGVRRRQPDTSLSRCRPTRPPRQSFVCGLLCNLPLRYRQIARAGGRKVGPHDARSLVVGIRSDARSLVVGVRRPHWGPPFTTLTKPWMSANLFFAGHEGLILHPPWPPSAPTFSPCRRAPTSRAPCPSLQVIAFRAPRSPS